MICSCRHPERKKWSRRVRRRRRRSFQEIKVMEFVLSKINERCISFQCSCQLMSIDTCEREREREGLICSTISMAFLLSLIFTRIDHGEEINRVTRTNERQSLKHIRRTSKRINRSHDLWDSLDFVFSFSLSIASQINVLQRRGKTRRTLVDHNPMH